MFVYSVLSDDVGTLFPHMEVGGVFKKRPNFLNSAPTSIESALQLLSALSVRF